MWTRKGILLKSLLMISCYVENNASQKTDSFNRICECFCVFKKKLMLKIEFANGFLIEIP